MHFGSEPDAFSKCSLSGTWGGILPAGDLQTVAASPLDACSTLQNAVALKGAVAVVTRGMCGFGDKAINVQVGYDIGILRIDFCHSTYWHVFRLCRVRALAQLL